MKSAKSKAAKEKKSAEPVRQLPTLYGLEGSDRVERGLIAPTQYLDWNYGGFEHVGDYYYNCWPYPRRGDGVHAWKNPEAGVHLSTDIADVEKLLEKPAEGKFSHARVTDRCVRQLMALGYEVVLRRSRTVTITHTLEMDVAYKGGEYRAPRITVLSDTLETKSWGVGKYKLTGV